jgi:hypothetical protein
LVSEGIRIGAVRKVWTCSLEELKIVVTFAAYLLPRGLGAAPQDSNHVEIMWHTEKRFECDLTIQNTSI